MNFGYRSIGDRLQRGSAQVVQELVLGGVKEGDAESGKLPEYEVNTPEVETGTKKVEVEVPTVEVESAEDGDDK